MTEGTKSYLIGCHNFFFHPLWVLLAWKLEYKRWPKLWQIICIFLHDIGHLGINYLSDPKMKDRHLVLGAKIAKKFFGMKGFLFIAGHTNSGYKRSLLWRADKRSWLVAPMWWLWSNYYIEWLSKGIKVTPPPEWKKIVKINFESDNQITNHELYLKYGKLK